MLTHPVGMASAGAALAESARLFLQSQDLSDDTAALGLVCLTAKVQKLMGPPDDRNDRAGCGAFGQLVVLHLFNQVVGQ